MRTHPHPTQTQTDHHNMTAILIESSLKTLIIIFVFGQFIISQTFYLCHLHYIKNLLLLL